MNRARISLLLFVVAALFAVAAASAGPGTVSADQVRRWQGERRSLLLVDVRQAQLFERRHIEGAINIPAFAVAKKGLPKGATIVLYDGGIGSVEAKEAAEKMSAAGYGSVLLLEGGLARWEAAGLPLKLTTGVLDTKLVEFVTAAELSQAMRDGLPMTLVDLRGPALFKAGSIPGAKNVNPAAVHQASASWQKDSLVVLFDNGDAESEKQAELLRRAGFKMVRYLYGGFPEWKRQNAS